MSEQSIGVGSVALSAGSDDGAPSSTGGDVPSAAGGGAAGASIAFAAGVASAGAAKVVSMSLVLAPIPGETVWVGGDKDVSDGSAGAGVVMPTG